MAIPKSCLHISQRKYKVMVTLFFCFVTAWLSYSVLSRTLYTGLVGRQDEGNTKDTVILSMVEKIKEGKSKGLVGRQDDGNNKDTVILSMVEKIKEGKSKGAVARPNEGSEKAILPMVKKTVEVKFKVVLPQGVNEIDYPPYEPELDSDFPTAVADSPRIPHIIHQTYKGEFIPSAYVNYLKSFTSLNPEWQYYFWTDESARKLIKEKHPYLLQMWDTYYNPMNKADALRYVVLYEFGGVYADLDFECLRPLDRVTFKYACIFPTEPFEQATLRFNTPYVITNALMMCRPKHPFIKQMMENLPFSHPFSDQLDVAGPTYVTQQYLIYNKFNATDYYRMQKNNGDNTPNFYKGSLAEDDDNAVYVPNSQYFINTLADFGNRRMRQVQQCRSFTNLGFYMKRACVDLVRRGRRTEHRFAFTYHHWSESYSKRVSAPTSNQIRTLVPRCKIY